MATLNQSYARLLPFRAAYRRGLLVRNPAAFRPWGDVVRALSRGQVTTWSVGGLRRTVRRLAAEGIIGSSLLNRARPPKGRRT